jgi:hypothetical protein
MAASGVAVITSKISSEDEEDEASLWRKNIAGGEDLPRWLVGEDEALVAALKREKATGRMRGNWPGVRGRGIYRPRASRFVPAITTAHPDRRNPNPMTRVKG